MVGTSVPKLIQLTDRVVDGMEIEMCRYVVRILIVCRVLNRAKLKDVVSLGDNDHAARMLSSRPLDTCTADRSVVPPHDATPYYVLPHTFYKSNGCLIRNRCNRTGFKNVILTKQGLRIPMCAGLVFARKIQVDIRRLVAVKAKEGFKGNGMAVPVIIRSALRAFFGWEVKAGPVTSVRDKLTIFTVWTNIMRAKGVDFRDTGHTGDEG